MKQHIDTAPIWDSYKADCECPICMLNAKVEASGVNYFLGESVMEPDQRIEVNKKGFCPRHLRQLYDAGNRLGLGLMLDTYMRETVKRLKTKGEEIKKAAAAEAGKSALKRIGKRGLEMNDTVDGLGEILDTCVMCERLKDNMDRYIYTILYMYKHEPEFPRLFAESKGMCMKHFKEALSAAPKHLSGEVLKQFVDTLVDIQISNCDRIEKEVEWFTLKFDYKNEDKPWGNSKDAVKRGVNKVREQILE